MRSLRRVLTLSLVHGILIIGAVFILLPFVWMLIDVDQVAVGNLRRRFQPVAEALQRRRKLTAAR